MLSLWVVSDRSQSNLSQSLAMPQFYKGLAIQCTVGRYPQPYDARYWTRTSDPYRVEVVLYQLS
jgi:hypothetical protein